MFFLSCHITLLATEPICCDRWWHSALLNDTSEGETLNIFPQKVFPSELKPRFPNFHFALIKKK